MNKLLDSAVISATIITPSITNCTFIKEDRIILLQNASKKGISIKFLTNFQDENNALIEKLMKQFDIKLTNIDSLTEMMIIDSMSVITINTSSNKNLNDEESILISESAYATALDNLVSEIWGNTENVEGLLKSKRWLEHVEISIKKATELLNEDGFQIKAPGIVVNSLSQNITFDNSFLESPQNKNIFERFCKQYPNRNSKKIFEV